MVDANDPLSHGSATESFQPLRNAQDFFARADRVNLKRIIREDDPVSTQQQQRLTKEHEQLHSIVQSTKGAGSF